MRIDASTSVMARLHPERNGRGLNIYNPYFEHAEVNAAYLLFSGSDPKKLLSGVRSLGLAGAVVAGSFESDANVPEYLDELHPISQRIGTIGMVSQRDGKLYGVYQGAFGLREAVARVSDIAGKRIVILGAGNVVRGFLALLELEGTRPQEVTICNRTVSNAENVAADFSWVDTVRPMSELDRCSGDIFINATHIGSPWNVGSEHIFSEEFLRGFGTVVDVTFVPSKPQLVAAAAKLGVRTSPGYKMFLFQAKYVLQSILGHTVDEPLYERLMLADFETNWS